ncbi:hypothetical protein TNCV_4828981 [Trichonephila clavipes]|nr:hypothetical protein TNCV_4828981 [Trichonephila clavipes]
MVSNHNHKAISSRSGRGSTVVKVTDSWQACHESEGSTTENPPCRGVMHVESAEAQTSSSWCGVEVRRGKGHLRCRPRPLNIVQNYKVHHQKPSR